MEVDSSTRAKRSNSFSGVEDKRLGLPKFSPRARRNSIEAVSFLVGKTATPKQNKSVLRAKKDHQSEGWLRPYIPKALHKGIKRKRDCREIASRPDTQQIGTNKWLRCDYPYVKPRLLDVNDTHIFGQSTRRHCTRPGPNLMSFQNSPPVVRVNTRR